MSDKYNDTINNIDTFLSTVNLNDDIEKIYEIFNDDSLKFDNERRKELDKLRNENYKRYNNIKISKYKNLPKEFNDIGEEIVNFYNCINVKDILTDNYEDSKNTKTIIDGIYVRITRLENMIKSYLKELTSKNDNDQSKFNINLFKNLNISDQEKNRIIKKYNDLVLYSSNISNNLYEELIIQVNRKKYISEILNFLNIQEEKSIESVTQEKLKPLNILINIEIDKYIQKFQYLEDLMPENCEYKDEFIEFKTLFNRIIAYDDTNYENAMQTFEILKSEKELQNKFNYFEEIFINEREKIKKEQNFIYEKIGIKNLISSLNYITNNYMDELSEENKSILDYVSTKLKSNKFDLIELNKAMKLVTSSIWNKEITDIYSFDFSKDYHFICSNNQFIDEKYEAIPISKNKLQDIPDNYEIGFICEYNDNVMYITENEDIMTSTIDDMSNLKTPMQLEEEYVNYKILNRIALNGFKTKLNAVYYINDGDRKKYFKALELANMYNLPLLEFKI